MIGHEIKCREILDKLLVSPVLKGRFITPQGLKSFFVKVFDYSKNAASLNSRIPKVFEIWLCRHWFENGFTDEEIANVVGHELAHTYRRDLWFIKRRGGVIWAIAFLALGTFVNPWFLFGVLLAGIVHSLICWWIELMTDRLSYMICSSIGGSFESAVKVLYEIGGEFHLMNFLMGKSSHPPLSIRLLSLYRLKPAESVPEVSTEA